MVSEDDEWQVQHNWHNMEVPIGRVGWWQEIIIPPLGLRSVTLAYLVAGFLENSIKLLVREVAPPFKLAFHRTVAIPPKLIRRHDTPRNAESDEPRCEASESGKSVGNHVTGI